ncbi:hypothetical protein [Thermosipho globiformans]|uniref:hypothetical protein n=1 Tax=Thermosipho globiformans TaxID=380685 RepID=UPI000F8D4FBD|nr:hypothetical protein [Thermosipho globiformans]
MATFQEKQYKQKNESYVRLTKYIESNNDYDDYNEWGSHDILSKFHEVVLLAKIIILRKLNTKVESHNAIVEHLEIINPELSEIYKNLKNLARKFRYEKLNPDKNSKILFEKSYMDFINLVRSII